jgi:raffinose/stachyose/melibiose transport system permease protein
VLAASTARRTVQRRWIDGVARGRLGYLFILPAFVFILLFSYYPAFSAIYHAFTRWDGATPAVWIGWQNFQSFLTDPEFGIAALNILKLTAFWMLLAVTVPLAVARLILSVASRRLQFVYRLCFVLPFVLPQVVIILLWQFIYAADGVLNHVLAVLHLSQWQSDWLGNPSTALYAVMAMGFPYVDGFGLLIYTAGLQAIPAEMKEAAAVDGASALRIFFSIEVPQIYGQLRLMWVLAIINGLQNFTQVLILTQGGPGYTTVVPGLYLYQDAFTNQNFGRASAVGTALFVVILALTVANLGLGRERGIPARGESRPVEGPRQAVRT